MDYDNTKCDACVVNTLSLFDRRPVQAVMNGYEMIKLAPAGGEFIKDAITVEIDFPVIQTPSYYDLSDTTLHLSFMTKTIANGDPNATGTKVKGSFINLPTSSFFSDVRLSIYDKPVEGGGNTYHYQSMINTLLQYSEDYKKEVLAVSGYFNEDPTKAD